MNFEIIELIVIGVVPTLMGFFAGNYKRNKHNESLYIKNLNEAMSSYRKIVDEIELKYDAQINRMAEKLTQYEAEIIVLRNRVKELEQELGHRTI
jgi:flagellar capping protein FliD